mmetsp:Transcript_1198/g.2698  ORF Transcript_1198/g.2698 Transcript_1198/m.2698 type:complete len:485 (+) Transcript_1198:5939-7393(+)
MGGGQLRPPQEDQRAQQPATQRPPGHPRSGGVRSAQFRGPLRGAGHASQGVCAQVQAETSLQQRLRLSAEHFVQPAGGQRHHLHRGGHQGVRQVHRAGGRTARRRCATGHVTSDHPVVQLRHQEGGLPHAGDGAGENQPRQLASSGAPADREDPHKVSGDLRHASEAAVQGGHGAPAGPGVPHISGAEHVRCAAEPRVHRGAVRDAQEPLQAGGGGHHGQQGAHASGHHPPRAVVRRTGAGRPTVHGPQRRAGHDVRADGAARGHGRGGPQCGRVQALRGVRRGHRQDRPHHPARHLLPTLLLQAAGRRQAVAQEVPHLQSIHRPAPGLGDLPGHLQASEGADKRPQEAGTAPRLPRTHQCRRPEPGRAWHLQTRHARHRHQILQPLHRRDRLQAAAAAHVDAGVRREEVRVPAEGARGPAAGRARDAALRPHQRLPEQRQHHQQPRPGDRALLGTAPVQQLGCDRLGAELRHVEPAGEAVPRV